MHLNENTASMLDPSVSVAPNPTVREPTVESVLNTSYSSGLVAWDNIYDYSATGDQASLNTFHDITIGREYPEDLPETEKTVEQDMGMGMVMIQVGKLFLWAIDDNGPTRPVPPEKSKGQVAFEELFQQHEDKLKEKESGPVELEPDQLHRLSYEAGRCARMDILWQLSNWNSDYHLLLRTLVIARRNRVPA